MAEDSAKNHAPATATQDTVNFDETYRPINNAYPAATGTACTVRTRDTLRSIARNVWGDATLWYLIAQATT